MKLTVEQRSEIISEMASSETGLNELMRVLLNSFSKQERALFLDEHKGEQGNGYRIFGNGKSSKTTKKKQHHKFPSGLGYPKPEGEGRRRILHTFSDITRIWDKGIFPYTQIAGKKLYRLSDLQRIL